MKRALALAAAVVFTAGACSSNKSSSSGGGSSSSSGGSGATAAPSSGGSTPGVTSTEIHIGGIYYKAFYGDAALGAQARIKELNDAGGVFGRKIVLDTMIDEGQDQTQDLNAAKTLVQQDHVFAVAPVMTASFAGADYLNSAKVPFFGWSIEPRWCGLEYGFGFEGNDCDETKTPLAADAGPAIAKLFPDGKFAGKTVALTAEDNQSAKVALQSFAAGAQHDGAKVVLVDTSMPTPPAVVSDYTPYAEKIMTSNNGQPPDLVETVNSVSDTEGLYKKLLQLGYKGIVQDFTLYDPRLAASTKGLVTEISFAPFETASTNPAVQQMVTALKAYQPNILLDQPAAAGYWTMDLFIAMLQKVGPDLTRDSFMKVANNFTYDYHGGAGVVSFPKYKTGTIPCLSFVRSNGTTFDVPVPLTCLSTYPNPLLAK